MKVMLSNRQVQDLQPYIDRVRSAAKLGSPGMLVAQIRWNDQERTAWIEPAFLPHELAKKITEQGRESVPGLVVNSDPTMY
jgi:hypothetical protein